MNKDHELQLSDQPLTLHRLLQPLWPNLQEWFHERNLLNQRGLLPASLQSQPRLAVAGAVAVPPAQWAELRALPCCCPWGCACHTALTRLWGTNTWLQRSLFWRGNCLHLHLSPLWGAWTPHCSQCVTRPSFLTSQGAGFASRNHRAYAVCLPAGMDLQCCWCWMVIARGKSLFCTWGTLFS